MVRGIVLDRDGTVIEHIPYLARPEEVRLLDTVVEALKLARENGVTLFLHTNQSGVGRGLFSIDDVHACNTRMIELLDLGKCPFERICIAPEKPGEPSLYRKPSPRFAIELMNDFGFNEREICYIGDRASDLQTAANARVRGVGVATGLDNLCQELRHYDLASQFPICNNLLSAVQLVLNEP